jgi:pSer/pThr/pTyr-binding forkhead associated (FHA) protein
MAGAAVVICRRGEPDRTVDLDDGVDVIVGSRPQTGDIRAIVVDAPGVSRRHLRLRAEHGAVDIEDLGSTFHTFLEDGLPITRWRAVVRTILTIGDVKLVVEPPVPEGDETQRHRALRVSRFALRRTLVALCRDHVVHPRGRGSWVLSHRDLEELFGGSPKAYQFSKDLQEIARDARIPASAEALIDWALATGEVGAEDVRWLDDVLENATGMRYEARIRQISRFQWLRAYHERPVR